MHLCNTRVRHKFEAICVSSRAKGSIIRVGWYDAPDRMEERGGEYIWANLKIPLISPSSFFGRAIFDVLYRRDTLHVRPKGYANIMRLFHNAGPHTRVLLSWSSSVRLILFPQKERGENASFSSNGRRTRGPIIRSWNLVKRIDSCYCAMHNQLLKHSPLERHNRRPARLWPLCTKSLKSSGC